MSEAAFWGAMGASSLVIAAELAFVLRPSRMVIGLVMAFGVGALISSVSFELVDPALEASELWRLGLGLGLGSLTFFAGDRLIERIGSGDRRQAADDEDAGGLGIVLGTVLDGIPESAVLGMTLVGGSDVSLALLAGIWVSNLPEALGSTVNMRTSGWSHGRIRRLWWAVVAISAASAGAGFALVDRASGLDGTLIQAFAAGALLTMIADEMAPEAYGRSRTYAGLATVAGFAVAVWLTALGA